MNLIMWSKLCFLVTFQPGSPCSLGRIPRLGHIVWVTLYGSHCVCNIMLVFSAQIWHIRRLIKVKYKYCRAHGIAIRKKKCISKKRSKKSVVIESVCASYRNFSAFVSFESARKVLRVLSGCHYYSHRKKKRAGLLAVLKNYKNNSLN